MIFRHSAYIGQKTTEQLFWKPFYMPLIATVKDISYIWWNTIVKNQTIICIGRASANPASNKTLWEKENNFFVSALTFQNECLIKLVFTYHIQMPKCLKPNRIPSET